MIKSKTSLFAIALLAAVAISASQARAATYNAGDLIMGFRATGGIGSSSNVLVDLGSAINFRDLGAANLINITSVGTDLDATFGITAGNSVAWYDRTDLSFGVVGVYSSASSGAVTSGDPVRTLYASQTRTAVGTVGSANSATPGSPTAISSTNQGTSAGNMISLASTFTNQAASGNNTAVAITGAGTNTWTSFTSGTTDFAAFNPGVEQTFGNGTWSGGTYGSVTNVEGAVDLYRILNTTSGASPSGTAHVGTYDATIVINQSGQISAVNAVPEPSTYALFGLGAAAIVFAARRRQLKA
ncbi:MAG: PEP-CTERM sorting domain-containing protein [Verrucomicrobiota bacterium]